MIRPLFALFIILSLSCSRVDNCSDQRESISIFDSAAIRIVYRSPKGSFLIKDKGGVYLPSDISVYDEHNQKVRFALHPKRSDEFEDYYVLSVYVINEKYPAPGHYNEQKLYVDFKTSKDVIDYNFNVKRLECEDILEYLNVKYNAKQVASIKNGFDAEFEVVKQ